MRTARFYSGEVDRVELIYTQFNSMIAFTPTLRTLIPLLPSGMEMEGDEMSAPASMRGLRTGIGYGFMRSRLQIRKAQRMSTRFPETDRADCFRTF